MWEADSGANFKVDQGKAFPEDITCCKKIRKPVTSDLHTRDVNCPTSLAPVSQLGSGEDES